MNISSEQLELFLDTVAQNPVRHARWLNTISMLEAIGARKIWKSQGKDGLNEQVLRHATEESRHALFFKRAAQRLQPERCHDYSEDEVLEGAAARHYFQSLDYGIFDRLCAEMDEGPARELAYLYVTHAIEERAHQIYPIYDRVLRRHRIPVTLRGIIEEEDQHLAEMVEELEAKDVDAGRRFTQFRDLECELFSVFFATLNDQAIAA